MIGGRVERAMLPYALVIACAASRLEAQGCGAAPRDLSAASARTRDIEIARASAPHRDVIADAASCTADTSYVSSRRFNLRGLRDTVRAALHRPTLRATAIGGVADSRDNGVMWAGRGASLYAGAALSIDAGPVHALMAPALWWAENRRFDIFPSRDTMRNRFASPWYAAQYSIDMPSRFGATPLTTFDLGASAIWASLGPFDAGVSASPQAWGPGLRAHLFLGPDAPGIPRIFLRTSRPIQTRLGTLSATGFLGTLSESRFFDADLSNDTRALWAWTAAINPANSESFTVGLAHGVMLSQSAFAGESDQLITLFLRARSPEDGFRGWAELGRMGGLPSLRQFLTVPYFGIAYLVGFEYAARQSAGTFMLSTELVNLEQPTDIRSIAPRDFYTNPAMPQGWTQRGRPLGVSTGPGSQSQWVAVDWIASRWSAGIFGERVRWNEDAFLREYLAYSNRHDVTLRTGMRLGVVARSYETTLQLSTGKRLNYLFQNGSYIPGFRTVDVSVPQLRLAITPLLK